MKFGLDLPAPVEKAFDYFISRLEELGIVVTHEGILAYFISDTHVKKIGDNQLRCLMRRDYLEQKVGPLKGTYLTKSIDLFLIILKDAGKFKISKDPTTETVKKASLAL